MLLFYICQVDSVETVLFQKDVKMQYFHFSASINYICERESLHTSLPLHNFSRQKQTQASGSL